jgi:hypothetical protein
MLLLHGICFVANPISGKKVQVVRTEKTEEGKKEIVKISFAYLGNKCLQCDYKFGSWTFVSCGFSHEDRWKRFAELLKLLMDARMHFAYMTVPYVVPKMFLTLQTANI